MMANPFGKMRRIKELGIDLGLDKAPPFILGLFGLFFTVHEVRLNNTTDADDYFYYICIFSLSVATISLISSLATAFALRVSEAFGRRLIGVRFDYRLSLFTVFLFPTLLASIVFFIITLVAWLLRILYYSGS